MEKLLKVIAWISVVLGGLAIVGSFSDEDFYAFTGGVLFAGLGGLVLAYIKKVNHA